jgi:DNA processing protein
VLGSGLDHIYPPEHRALAGEIAQSGAVIGEYALGVRPEARNFPPRNRIISGLSLVVVVVEAGEASGALITANFAAEQGREVFAVPGSIHNPASRGCHKLIQTGAQIMLSSEEVIEALNMDVVVRQEAMQLELPEGDVERAVYQQLGEDPIHVDELGARCGLPISAVTSALAMLELKGRARQAGGMSYIVARETPPEYRVE